MWAVTGSSMARFWIELGCMPTNSLVPLFHGRTVNLPSRHSPMAMIRILRSLTVTSTQPMNKAQKRDILVWAENAAMLTYAFLEFQAEGPMKIDDMELFLDDLTRSKIVQEVSMTPISFCLDDGME